MTLGMVKTHRIGRFAAKLLRTKRLVLSMVKVQRLGGGRFSLNITTCKHNAASHNVVNGELKIESVRIERCV